VRRKIPERQVKVAVKFCTVAPNTSWTYVWNLLQVTLVAPKVSRWPLDSWATCAVHSNNNEVMKSDLFITYMEFQLHVLHIYWLQLILSGTNEYISFKYLLPPPSSSYFVCMCVSACAHRLKLTTNTNILVTDVRKKSAIPPFWNDGIETLVYINDEKSKMCSGPFIRSFQLLFVIIKRIS
jgi:hypothetical protein